MMGSRTLSAGLAGGVHAGLLAALLFSWNAASTKAGDGRHSLTVLSMDSSQNSVEQAADAAAKGATERPEPKPAVMPEAMAAAVPPPLRLYLARVEAPAMVAAPSLTNGPAALAVPALSGNANGAATGASGSSVAETTSAAPARAAGSGATPPDGYALRVFRHIRHYKAFPSSLADKGCVGTVLARFTITREGRLDHLVLAKSSGFSELDRLALEQLRQAAPFPKPPSGTTEAAFSFLVPMTYRLDA